MLARVEKWCGQFGYLVRTDELGQLVKYFLPLGEIKFLGVDTDLPQPWNWVAFLAGVSSRRTLANGRPACPIAKFASVFAFKSEAQSADALISFGASRKDLAVASHKEAGRE
jgi:hypothetical protein